MTRGPNAGASLTELTELFETDALLDAIGRRDPASLAPGSLTSDLAVAFLVSLAVSIDGEIERPAELSPGPRLRLLPTGSECGQRVQVGHMRQLSAAGALAHLARRTVPRRRTNGLVAAVTGALIVLGGGGLAAAATTDPGSSWGPIKPIVRVLHPGWVADGVASRRDEVERELARAQRQSKAGNRAAARAAYGAARERERTLPSGADPGLGSRLDQLARQLGLSEGADPLGGSTDRGGSTGVTELAGGVGGPGELLLGVGSPTDPATGLDLDPGAPEVDGAGGVDGTGGVDGVNPDGSSAGDPSGDSTVGGDSDGSTPATGSASVPPPLALPIGPPPAADPPAADPPVTDPPVTDPPVTDPPVTDPPVTDPPVTDPPVTTAPVTTPPTDGSAPVTAPVSTVLPPVITTPTATPTPTPTATPTPTSTPPPTPTATATATPPSVAPITPVTSATRPG